MTPKLLTYGEAADTMAISKRTLERKIPMWINEGRVKVVVLGKAKRISPDDLNKLIESLKVGAR